MINGSMPLMPGNGRGKADASSVAQRLDRWRDVLSRLTANPDLGHLPRRMRQRVCQLLYRTGIYHLPTRPIYRGLEGPVDIQLLPDEHLTRRLWFGGYVEYDEDYFLRRFLRPGMVAIDGGANVGHLTLISAVRVGPTGQVHAFEPASATYDVLRENIRANGLDGIVVSNRLALADHSNVSVDLVGVVRHSELTRIRFGGPTLIEGDPAAGDGRVTTVTLDDYVRSRGLARVDFLKLDLEGAEILAVAGARDLLARHRPVVLCEFNGAALLDFGSSVSALSRSWAEADYAFYLYNHRARRLVRHEPGDTRTTLVGTTNPRALADHLGARIT